MSDRKIFEGYARQDAEVAQTVADQIEQLGLTSWLDKRLTGGMDWWNEITARIRECDCFVFLLSDASLRSKACQSELGYAHRLRKPILPVAVGTVIDQLLPPYLAETQRVPVGDIAQLARALMKVPLAPELPDPLPPPPPVPLSYLDDLASALNRDDLPLADQRNLLGALRQVAQDEDERAAAIELLRRLRRHTHVNAWVAEEVDAELARLTHPDQSTPPVQESPPPAQQVQQPVPPVQPPPATYSSTPARAAPRNRTALWAMLAVLGLGTIAVAGLFVAQSGDDNDGSDRTPGGDGPASDPEEEPASDPDEEPASDPDEELAQLNESCEDGDMRACDDLFFDSEAGSSFEEYGATCGGVDSGENAGSCASLGAMAVGCNDGDMAACDELYFESEAGSDFEQFGATCGGLDDGGNSGFCEEAYG
jgi:hypothetical protein